MPSRESDRCHSFGGKPTQIVTGLPFNGGKLLDCDGGIFVMAGNK